LIFSFLIVISDFGNSWLLGSNSRFVMSIIRGKNILMNCLWLWFLVLFCINNFKHSALCIQSLSRQLFLARFLNSSEQYHIIHSVVLCKMIMLADRIILSCSLIFSDWFKLVAFWITYLEIAITRLSSTLWNMYLRYLERSFFIIKRDRICDRVIVFLFHIHSSNCGHVF
jgi:hypothetical protein